jgi:hypothetical protein
MDEEKVQSLSRNQLRSYVVDHHRVGGRTGTTPHFAQWKAEGKVKSALQKLKTDRLADDISGADKAASGFALLYLAGFKNVWQIAQAKRADLLDAKGVGIAMLGHVEDYLAARNVQLSWSVHN